MAMPQALRDARGYRSRYINALNAAIKAIAPITERGIRLRQTPQGLPPRGRGRGPTFAHLGEQAGITPAWAGKSQCHSCAPFSKRDYPRVGGEESGTSSRSAGTTGLPPRGRGRDRCSRFYEC